MLLDPIKALRADATKKVNQHFNMLAGYTAHRDQAYAAKREAAKRWADLADDHPLVAEAKLRGITVEQLAQTILNKPNTVEQRELDRQIMMTQVDAAKTPEELATIVRQIPEFYPV